VLEEEGEEEVRRVRGGRGGVQRLWVDVLGERGREIQEEGEGEGKMQEVEGEGVEDGRIGISDSEDTFLSFLFLLFPFVL